MHGFKSAILASFPFWQNRTFEPVDEIQKFFWPKDFFWGIMKVPFTKTICNLFQGPPNPVFRSVKVQIGTFFKKDSQDFKNSFCCGSYESLACLECKFRRCPFSVKCLIVCTFFFHLFIQLICATTYDIIQMESGQVSYIYVLTWLKMNTFLSFRFGTFSPYPLHA